MNILQIELTEIKHARKARRLEYVLRKRKGVSDVSISTSGMVQLRWDVDQANQSEILQSIKDLGYHIRAVKNTHEDKEVVMGNTKCFQCFWF